MKSSDSVTMAEVAEALGIRKQGVQRRATREAWPFEEVAVRGGKKRLYKTADLPRVIVRKLAARRAIKAVKAAMPEVPASFILVVDGEVFQVRQVSA